MSIKELLERWSRLEPHLCKRETRPNKDWHEEFEDYYVQTDRGWERVYTDGDYNSRINKDGLMWIQWVIQQALISERYDLMMEYTPEFGYKVEAGLYQGESDTSMSEALLAAYIKTLEDA